MTQQEVQAMITNTINGTSNASQFSVSKVPYHTHNGVDSPYVSVNNTSQNGLMKVATYDPAGVSQQLVGTSATQTLTNKTLTTPIISTISNTGTLTLPTSTDTLVGRATTDVLTNKTLTKPTINASVQGVQAMSAQALDGTTANIFTRTLAASETFTQSGFVAGQVFMVEVTQGSGTSYTVTWFSTVTWVTTGASAPVQTTTSSGITTYGFRCTGTNTFLGYLIGTN